MYLKTNPKYVSKYDKIIKKYSFDELQNLLDTCESKTDLSLKLGISLKYFNMIITINGLKYTKKAQGLPKKEETIQTRLTQEMISEDTALARFYKELAAKKRKRLIKETFDPYGD